MLRSAPKIRSFVHNFIVDQRLLISVWIRTDVLRISFILCFKLCTARTYFYRRPEWFYPTARSLCSGLYEILPRVEIEVSRNIVFYDTFLDKNVKQYPRLWLPKKTKREPPFRYPNYMGIFVAKQLRNY